MFDIDTELKLGRKVTIVEHLPPKHQDKIAPEIARLVESDLPGFYKRLRRRGLTPQEAMDEARCSMATRAKFNVRKKYGTRVVTSAAPD